MYDKYYDFFEEKLHIENQVTIDELIYEATRTDLVIDDLNEKIKFLETSKTTLKNELFTCYYYLKEKGLLDEYHKYRNGE